MKIDVFMQSNKRVWVNYPQKNACKAPSVNRSAFILAANHPLTSSFPSSTPRTRNWTLRILAKSGLASRSPTAVQSTRSRSGSVESQTVKASSLTFLERMLDRKGMIQEYGKPEAPDSTLSRREFSGSGGSRKGK